MELVYRPQQITAKHASSRGGEDIDAQQLTEHIKQTPTYIRRHRGRMIPGGIGYSDTPAFGGFGSKSPCSDHAMELADMEAAFLGNLAHYCIQIGTVPPVSLKPFWFVNGTCLGLRALGHDEDEINIWGEHTGYDYLAPLYPIVDHLVRYVPFILGTEGVEELLEAGQETRWYSKKMFPEEEDDWIDEPTAMELVGRTVQTLREWRRSGTVRFIKDKQSILYKKDDLQLMAEIREGNRMRNHLMREPI